MLVFCHCFAGHGTRRHTGKDITHRVCSKLSVITDKRFVPFVCCLADWVLMIPIGCMGLFAHIAFRGAAFAFAGDIAAQPHSNDLSPYPAAISLDLCQRFNGQHFRQRFAR